MKRLILPVAILALIGGYYAYKYMHVPPAVITGMVSVTDSHLGSMLGGRVTAIRFREGQKVTKGDVIVQLDDRMSSLQLAIAKMRLMEGGGATHNFSIARDQYAMAQLNMDETRITAPYDGVIDTISVEVGDIVAPNQRVVVIRKDRALTITGYLPSSQLQQVALGDVLTFETDFDATPHTAKVVSIASKTEFIPKSISTKEDRALWISKSN